MTPDAADTDKPTACPLVSCERVERLAMTQAEHGRRLALLEQREEEYERVIRENTRALLAARTAIDEARIVIAKAARR